MARIFLLDKSGSMEGRLDDTIGGFNAFLREQKSLGMGGTMSLYTFSDKCKCEYRDVPIDDVPMLTRETYIPDGCTALYDAMGHILKEYAGKEGTFVVLTDGQENSSKKYTKSHVKDLIELSSPKLKVMYVGVDIDDAVDMGISHTMMYEAVRTPDIFRSVSESVSADVVKLIQSQPTGKVCSTGANDSTTRRCTSQ